MPAYRFIGAYPTFYPQERDADGQSLTAEPGVVIEFEGSPPTDGNWIPFEDSPAPAEPVVQPPPVEPEPVPEPPAPVPVPPPVPEAPEPLPEAAPAAPHQPGLPRIFVSPYARH